MNKLQALASIQNSLNTLEDRKLGKKKDLERQLEKIQQTCDRLTEKIGGYLDPKEKAEYEERLGIAKTRLSDMRSRIANLDNAFEKEREKLINNRNMTAGMLRQAQRDGRLPFAPDLIDNPTNLIVSTKGQLFCAGDYLEFTNEKTLWKINKINTKTRELILTSLSHNYNSYYKVEDLPTCQKILLLEDDIPNVKTKKP